MKVVNQTRYYSDKNYRKQVDKEYKKYREEGYADKQNAKEIVKNTNISELYNQIKNDDGSSYNRMYELRSRLNSYIEAKNKLGQKASNKALEYQKDLNSRYDDAMVVSQTAPEKLRELADASAMNKYAEFARSGQMNLANRAIGRMLNNQVRYDIATGKLNPQPRHLTKEEGRDLAIARLQNQKEIEARQKEVDALGADIEFYKNDKGATKVDLDKIKNTNVNANSAQANLDNFRNNVNGQNQSGNAFDNIRNFASTYNPSEYMSEGDKMLVDRGYSSIEEMEADYERKKTDLNALKTQNFSNAYAQTEAGRNQQGAANLYNNLTDEQKNDIEATDSIWEHAKTFAYNALNRIGAGNTLAYGGEINPNAHYESRTEKMLKDKYQMDDAMAQFYGENYDSVKDMINTGGQYDAFKAEADRYTDEERELLAQYVIGKEKSNSSNVGRKAIEDSRIAYDGLKALGWSDEQIKESAKRYKVVLDTDAYNEQHKAITDAIMKSNAQAVKYNALDLGTFLPASVEGAVETARQKFGGEYTNPYASGYNLLNMANITEEATNEKIDNPYGQFFYGAGMSTVKSLETMALGMGVGQMAGALGMTEKAASVLANVATLPAFGSSAYQSTLKEATERGLGTKKATELAIMNGLNEMLFEVVSFDKAYGMFKKYGGKKTKEILTKGWVDMIIQSGIEGSEEGATDLANWAADELINNSFSEYELLVKKVGKEEADRQFRNRFLTDMGAGAVSGLFSGGGALGASAVKTRITTNDAANAVLGNETATKKLVEAALKMNKDSKAYKVASSLEDNATPTKKQVRAIIESAGKETTVRNAVKDAFVESGMSEEEAERSIDNIAIAEYTGNTDNLSEQELEQYNAINEDVYEANNAAETVGRAVNYAKQERDLQSRKLNAKEVNNETKAKVDTAQENIEGKVDSENADDITSVASIENGVATYNLKDGSTVKSTEAVYKNDDIGLALETSIQFGYDAQTTNEVVNMMSSKPKNMSASDFLMGVNEAFRYGQIGYALNKANSKGFINGLTESQKQFAYKAGAEASQRRAEARANELSKASVKGTRSGKVHYASSLKGLSERQLASKTLIERVTAEVTHNDVFLYESVVENGKRVFAQDIAGYKKGTKAPNGFYKNGVIYLDINAGNKGEGTMLWTYAHELTHFVRDWSPTKFKALGDFVISEYSNAGVPVEELVARQIQKAKDNGHSLTWDGAYEEVIADSMQQMFTDNNLAEKLAKLKQQDMTLWEKVKEWFENLAKEIAKAYKGLTMGTPEADAMLKVQKQVDRIADMFAESIVEAGNTYEATHREIDSKSFEKVMKRELKNKNILNHDRFVEPHLDLINQNYNAENAAIELDTLLKRYNKVVDIWREIGGELNSKFLNEWNNQEYKDRAFAVFKAQTGYKYNAELSTMCKKGIPLFEAIDTIVKKEITKQLNTDVIGKAEKEILYDLLKTKGFEIPCAICYVEQARQREGVIIDAFINGKVETDKNGKPKKTKLGWNATLDRIEAKMKELGVDYSFDTVSRDIATEKYVPKSIEMDEETQGAFYEAIRLLANEEIARRNKEDKPKNPLKPIKDSNPETVNATLKGRLTPNLQIFKILFNDKDSRIRLESDLLYSSMTTRNLATAHNSLYSLFNSQGGVSGYKTKQGSVVYLGEILKKKWTSEQTKKEGGIRNQSNSDFMMYTLLDQAQIYVDLSAKGYYLHAYTKVLAELKLFGLSGAKINASLIPAVNVIYNKDGSVNYEETQLNAGLDENGNPIYDDFEGINHEEAFMLLDDPEYSKNVSGICIGYSDKHIMKLLDEPRVQEIIGFHDKTNDPNKRYKGARYAKNYNGLNEATKLKADGTTETKHIGFNQFVIKAEKMFSQNADGDFEGMAKHKGKTYMADDIPRLATDLYLEYCEKKNLTPAYHIAVGEDANGNTIYMSDHPNYYKLMGDFGLRNSEGKYAPHKKVQFNMPSTVPYLENGQKKTMPTKDFIKAELEKELKVRDDIANALADESEDGIIPQFVERVNSLNEAKLSDRDSRQDVYHQMAEEISGLYASFDGYDYMDNYMDGMEEDIANAIKDGDYSYLDRIEEIYEDLDEDEQKIADRLFEQAEALKSNNADIRYSDRDSRYLELAKNPEANRAELQKMVDETAKSAGYTSRAYHGTKKMGFTEFNPAFSKDQISMFFSSSIDTASSYSGESMLYGDKLDVKKLGYSALNYMVKNLIEPMKVKNLVKTESGYDITGFSMEKGSHTIKSFSSLNDVRNWISENHPDAIASYSSGVYSVYLKTEKPLVVNAGIDVDDEIPRVTFSYNDNEGYLGITYWTPIGNFSERVKMEDINGYVNKYFVGNPKQALSAINKAINGDVKVAEVRDTHVKKSLASNWNNISFRGEKTNTRTISKYAYDNGYDSVIIKNVTDNGGLGDNEYNASDITIVFDSNNIKLANPVTYDDNGNVIPLAERFNTENNDIRFSDRTNMTDSEIRDTIKRYHIDVSEEELGYATKGLRNILKQIDKVKNKRLRTDDTVRTIALNITSEFVKRGYTNFNGIKLDSDANKQAYELAAYAMILRNPMFETSRLFYVKDNEIIANEAYTSYLVDSTQITNATSQIYDIKNRMKRLNADGFYLLHNHPSGDATPSGENGDIGLSNNFAQIDGYRGSIVIDHNKYSFITPNSEVHENIDITEDTDSRDYNKEMIDNPFSGLEATDEVIAEFGKNIVHGDNHSLVVYIGKGRVVRGVQEIKNSFVLSKDFSRYVANRKVDFGSMHAVLYTDNEDVIWNQTLRDSITKNIFGAIIQFDENGINTIDHTFDDYYPDPLYNSKGVSILDDKSYRLYMPSEDIQFSDRDINATDNRTLLSNAMLEVAQNPTEEKRIAEYQSKIDYINKQQNKIAELNKKIRELEKSGTYKDLQESKKLKIEANKAANRIDVADKRLLELEASKPLMDVLEREKEKAYAKAKEQGEKALNNYRAKTKATVTRDKLKKARNDLERWLKGQNTELYVPRGMVQRVIDVCVALDPTGVRQDTKAAKEFRDSREALLSLKEQYDRFDGDNENNGNVDYDYTLAYDRAFSNMIAKFAEKLGNKPIRDLSNTELEDVYEIVNEIKHMVMTARQIIGYNDRVTSYSAGQNIIDNMNAVKRKGLNKGIFTHSKAGDVLRNWMSNPMRAVKEMSGYDEDSMLIKAFNDLNDGRIKADKFRMDVNKTFEAHVNGNRKAFNEAVEKPIELGFKDLDGNDVKLTKMQMMSAILTWERETANANRNHLDSLVLFPDAKLERKGDYDGALDNGVRININDGIISQFNSKMSEWDNEYLDLAREFFRETSRDAIDSTMMQIKGRLIATEKNYFPYKVNEEYLRKESDNLKFDSTILGMGMLKSVVNNAPQGLVMQGLNGVISRHTDDVAKVYGLAIPVQNWNKIFNMKQTNKAGGRSVKQLINTTWGVGSRKMIEQAVADLQSPRKSIVPKAVGKFRSAFVVSTLASNISVWMKQAASYPTAGAVLNSSSLTKGLGDYATANKQELFDEIDAHTPQHWTRRQGMSTAELGDANQTGGWNNFLNEKMGKGAKLNPMNWIQAMDVGTTGALWCATKREVESMGYKAGTDEYWNKVTELYNKVLEETQPMYDSLHRAEVSKNQFYSNFIMFVTQPIQNSGILREGAQRYKMARKEFGKDSAEAKASAKVYRKAVTSQLASHFTFTLMTLISKALMHKMDDYRDKDKELTAESVLGEFFKQLGKNYFRAIVPVVGSIMVGMEEKMFEGNRYDVLSDPTIERVNTLIDDFGKITDPSLKNYEKLFMDVASAFGVPLPNAKNIIKGAILNGQDIINGEFFEAGLERTDTQELNIAYKAYENGDTEKARKFIDRIKSDNLKSSMTNKFKNEYVSADDNTRNQIESFLRSAGYEDIDVLDATSRWEYASEHGGSQKGFSKYFKLDEALNNGDVPSELLAVYTDDNSKKNAHDHINDWFKDYTKANGKSANVQAMVLTAFQRLGYDRNSEQKKITNWYNDEYKKWLKENK